MESAASLIYLYTNLHQGESLWLIVYLLSIAPIISSLLNDVRTDPPLAHTWEVRRGKLGGGANLTPHCKFYALKLLHIETNYSDKKTLFLNIKYYYCISVFVMLSATIDDAVLWHCALWPISRNFRKMQEYVANEIQEIYEKGIIKGIYNYLWMEWMNFAGFQRMNNGYGSTDLRLDTSTEITKVN